MSKPSERVWNNEEPQPIAVPLLGHHTQLHNGSAYKHDYGFVGRGNLIEELLTILNETRNGKGCFLISGFRGMGKTTLINKVINRYANGTTGPAWLPTEARDKNNIYPRGLETIFGRGKQKLDAYETKIPLSLFKRWLNKASFFISRLWTITTIKKYFYSRVITVKINLGQDHTLEPREVLFNTATLLYQKLRDKRKYGRRLIDLLLCVTISLLLSFIIYHIIDNITVSRELFCRIQCYANLPAWLVPKIFTWPQLAGGLFFVINFFFGYYLLIRHIPTHTHIIHRLKRLNKRIVFSIEFNKGFKYQGVHLKQKETAPPLDAQQIEAELLYILKLCRKVPCYLGKPDIIFVFDELDKIAHRPVNDNNNAAERHSVGRDMHERKKKVDDLLGTLKNFITHGTARFFFIAGREMLDSYQAERGSTSSLYESLFSRVFEVPSLLTDRSDHNPKRMHSLMEVYLCRKLMDPDVAIYLWMKHKNIDPSTRKSRSDQSDDNLNDDSYRKLMYSPFCLRTYYHYLTESKYEDNKDNKEAKRIVLGLRNFIQFLTLHSWGNPKRMMSLFDHFTKDIESVDWRQKKYFKNTSKAVNNLTLALQFSLIDQQRIVLASNLYTHLYHDLGRQLTSSGDKLAVSTMAAFQYILKFHRHPFSRYHLERMSETISVYHAPELNTMIDTLLSKVLHQHIRRIRNSHYRYRFVGDFEQELRYISRINDIESAAFNFSLDASAPIKSHYIDQLNTMTGENSKSQKGSVVIYELCMIIGDLFAQEQSHDVAFTYYQRAADVFGKDSNERQIGSAHLYVEALLRLGEIYEQCQRHDKAAGVYLKAISVVRKIGEDKSSEWYLALESGDSKWDIFRQPCWAYWYLQLKRSPVSSRDKLPAKIEYPFINNNDDAVNHYRSGQLSFFYGCHYTAVKSFILAIIKSGVFSAQTERTTYIGAYAYLHLGENIFVGMMRYMREDINSKKDNKSTVDDEKIYSKLIINKCDFVDREKELYSLEDIENHYCRSKVGYLKRLYDIDDKSTFIDKIDVYKTLGMMVFAAKKMAERGLHYHAAFGYLKIISIWGMLSEVLSALHDIEQRKQSPLVRTENSESAIQDIQNVLKQSDKWMFDIKLRAAESVNFLTMGGFDRFHARWKGRDIDEFAKFDGNENRIKHSHEDDSENDDEMKASIRILFGDKEPDSIISTSSRERVSRRKSELLSNPLFLHRSLMGQKLLHLSLWEYMAKARFITNDDILKINHQPMVPHSTRNLIFIHWLSGRRYLHREVLARVKDINELNIKDLRLTKKTAYEKFRDLVKSEKKTEQQIIDLCKYFNGSESDVLQELDKSLSSCDICGLKNHGAILMCANEFKSAYEKVEAARKEIYNAAAAAVHNLHRAFYYTRQLAGNDQELMFPDSAMILYDIWCLLYCLLEWEIEEQDTQKKSIHKAIRSIKDELKSNDRRENDTPANFYDFNNVTYRTIDALRDTENMGDITNRARSDAIRTRHYLADDYEDPRFHLDWTLVQMYSPTAGMLRRDIERIIEKIENIQ